MYFYEYIYILSGVFLLSVITIVVLIPSFSVSFDFVDIESSSPYECGFQPFEATRQKFDIQFYLVAILFIIFDLEVMFLIPFSISLNILTNFGLGLGVLFLVILGIGILYEWRYKALNWTNRK